MILSCAKKTRMYTNKLMLYFIILAPIYTNLLGKNEKIIDVLQRPELLRKTGSLYNSPKTLSAERLIIWQHWVNQLNTLAEKGITRKQLDIIDNAPDEIKEIFVLLRIQIIDQKIYAKSWSSWDPVREEIFLNALKKVVSKYKIKNVDFLVFLDEAAGYQDVNWDLLYRKHKISLPLHGIRWNEIKSNYREKWDDILHSIPAFASDKDPKNIYQNNIILIPDLFMLNCPMPNFVIPNCPMWSKLFTAIKSANNKYPWSKKRIRFYGEELPQAVLIV